MGLKKMMEALVLLSFLSFLAIASSNNQQQVYIVYCGEHSGLKTQQEISDDHHSKLLSVKSSEEEARSSLLYSYRNSVNGFAALLSSDEATKLSEMEDVVTAFPSQARSMHTTRTWEFLGLESKTKKNRKGLLHEAKHGKDVIVGLLDSGIWPESKSFSDEGMSPVPSSWKGICQGGDAWNSSHCNRKLIGARYYLKAYEIYYGRLDTTAEYRSPRDHDGHGTHTSSTVGGRKVSQASALGGFAMGTASGGAPLVRLAMYKVCWPIPGGNPALENTCFEADMLAAMDDALGDGVNVMSISIGTSGTPLNYSADGIAIGALHAVKKNVVVACSGGNSGPAPATVSNLAPWIITVAASSVDRLFPSPVMLGNGNVIQGQTVTPYKLRNSLYPLIFSADAVLPGIPKNNITAGQCLPGSLDPSKVKGKIVFCLRGNGPRVGKGFEVQRAGGAGIILGNLPSNGAEISVDANVLPGTSVTSTAATEILQYINCTQKPVAKIVPAKTLLGVKPAPFMAAFSSTGPNALEPNILKPDITAPGLNILAAWSESSSPTKLSDDHRSVKYNLISGTSMSCPHVAATAALLKSIHPHWSSAAIRSALMTTASVKNNQRQLLTNASGNLAGPFNYGAGHLRPTHVSDPGLVYDASYTDYLLFLCNRGFSLDPSFKCPKVSPSPSDLNHPSVAISNINGMRTVTRTVTNVGSRGSTYFASVRAPAGFTVEISPRVLDFKRVGEKKSFTIKFQAGAKASMKSGEYVFGWYKWSDGVHNVRSPIAVSHA